MFNLLASLSGGCMSSFESFAAMNIFVCGAATVLTAIGMTKLEAFLDERYAILEYAKNCAISTDPEMVNSVDSEMVDEQLSLADKEDASLTQSKAKLLFEEYLKKTCSVPTPEYVGSDRETFVRSMIKHARQVHYPFLLRFMA